MEPHYPVYIDLQLAEGQRSGRAGHDMYGVIEAGTILWQTNLYRAKDTVRARHQIDSLAEGAKVIPSFCGDAIHPSGQQDLGVDHVIRGREF